MVSVAGIVPLSAQRAEGLTLPALPNGTRFCEVGPPAQASVRWLCHTVQPGEWLWKIARDETFTPVTPERVAKAANFIYALNRTRIGANPNSIHPGMTLLVGFYSTPNPVLTNADNHGSFQFRRGETVEVWLTGDGHGCCRAATSNRSDVLAVVSQSEDPITGDSKAVFKAVGLGSANVASGLQCNSSHAVASTGPGPVVVCPALGLWGVQVEVASPS